MYSVGLTALALVPAFALAQAPSMTTVPLDSLLSSNPTAVPLTALVSNPATQTTVPLNSAATPGATPPVSGAPPLPSWAFSPSLGFPALDVVPPTNSSLVQQWIAEVKATGIQIPDIALSVGDGTCAANPQKVANNSAICWWTCGGCTRETDITTCPDKMTWGLSYDDGPSPYTTDLLNYLNANELKSTFFIVGSRAISRPNILQAEYMSGHQLSVHTWSHPYLTTLTNEQVIAELGWTKKALKDITGVTPNTMRPPYGDIDDRIRAICKAMGLTPIMWSGTGNDEYDTEDWHIPAGYPVNNVIDNFEHILNNASSRSDGFIVLEHDLYQQTVDLAIGYILPDAMARKDITFKSIIDCLHKPLSDAYIETNNNSTNPPGDGATTIPSSSSATSGSGSSATTSAKISYSTSGSVTISISPQGGQGGSATNKSGAASPLTSFRGLDFATTAVAGLLCAAAGALLVL